MGKPIDPEKYDMAFCPPRFLFLLIIVIFQNPLRGWRERHRMEWQLGRQDNLNIMFKTMLVEDSLSFRQLVKDNLQNQSPSIDIIEAGDETEAFQKIDSHPSNLIFMDIRLPEGNGLELTRKIKMDHPDIIIIILTSYDSLEYQGAAT